MQILKKMRFHEIFMENLHENHIHALSFMYRFHMESSIFDTTKSYAKFI